MRRGKRAPRVVAALLLALAMLAGLVPVAAADEPGQGHGRKGFERGEDFEDMGQAEWAARYVVTGRMTGLIRGYEENGRFKFKPNQPVNRQEAVAMTVRALGLEDEAGTVSDAVYRLPYRDADHIQPWARGYVAVALERGLLDADEEMFRPMAAASRVWTVKLLVRALGLEEQARQRMGEALPFRDAPAIPEDAVGYVAVAVDVGLIAGYEDSTFRPNKPVTRAEMAKLLEVLTGELQQPGTPQEGIVHGLVTAVGADSLTLRLGSGAERTVKVAADAYVFVDGARATLADVRPGQMARLYLDAEGRAVLVDARSLPALPKPPRAERHPLKRTVVGVVEAVAPQIVCVRAPCAGGTITVQVRDKGMPPKTETFPVAESVEVEIEGYGYATLADVRPGDRVKLKLRGGVVVEIEVKEAEDEDEGAPEPGQQQPVAVGKVRGVIAALGSGTVDVTQDGGPTVTIRVDERTMVWIGKWLGDLGDLRVGDRVEVRVAAGVAVRIKVDDGGERDRGRGKDKGKDDGGSED